jgi:hypothetical protein
MHLRNWRSALVGLGAVCALVALPATSHALPVGWSCTGNCGTSGPDGVVTAPPDGTGSYEWVSTSGGLSGVGSLGLGFNETNGSLLESVTFSANAGDELQFYFNYVTSDGAGFPEYGWAGLVDTSDPTDTFLLFTARTSQTAGEDTVPGTGMPPLGAGVSLTPATTPIIPGGPVWSPLGGSSGACWDVGCGYTGWIQMTYTIVTAGTYFLQFGVTNVNDTAFDSGLAVSGASIGGVPIGPPIPEPGVLALLGLGLAMTGRRLNARRRSA